MPAEATLHTHYVGKVLADGHLEMPPSIAERMGLKDGDEVVVVLHKITSTAPGISLPEEAHALIHELIGSPRNMEEAVEALTAIATEMMPPRQQRRVSHLLGKNQDGTLTMQEEAELDALIDEGQQATLRKAKAMLALKHLGIDIVAALGSHVRPQ